MFKLRTTYIFLDGMNVSLIIFPLIVCGVELFIKHRTLLAKRCLSKEMLQRYITTI